MRARTFQCIAAAALTVGVADASAQTPSQVDPLRSFKEVIAACEAQVNGRAPETVRRLDGGDWAHDFQPPATIKYDVKRTDSLVSPYVASMTLDVTRYVARSKTEEEARAATRNGATMLNEIFDLRYALQETGWKFTGATFRSTLQMEGERSPSHFGPSQMSPESFAKYAWMSSCVQ